MSEEEKISELQVLIAKLIPIFHDIKNYLRVNYSPREMIEIELNLGMSIITINEKKQ